MNKILTNKAAENWNEAFPIGNGRLGAKIFGNVNHEIIQLNEESIWSSSFSQRNNKTSPKELKHIRDLINLNRFDEAQELAFESLTANPEEMSYYESAGEIHLDFYDGETYGIKGPFPNRSETNSYNSYKRELNLEQGIANTTFSIESITPSTADFSSKTSGSSISYSRECFASSQSDVLVYHISSNIPKSIYFRARFHNDKKSKVVTLSDDTIVMQNTSGIPYSIMLTAICSGGKTQIKGDNLIIEKSDDVILYIDIQTAFRKRKYQKRKGNVKTKASSLCNWCNDKALRNICMASSLPFEKLKQYHIEKFSSLYNKTNLLLGDENENSEIFLNSFDKLPDDKQTELKWKFYLYTLISSSQKPGTLPSLENGLWYNGNEPKDERRFNITDETFSNSLASKCFMNSFEESKYNLIKKLYKNGKITAREMYDCLGTVAHSHTDIWGDSAPNGMDFRFSYKNLGFAIFSNFLTDNFEFNFDYRKLKKFWKLQKSNYSFFHDYLTSIDDNQHLVLTPAFENKKDSYICCENQNDTKTLQSSFINNLKSAKYLNYKDSDHSVLILNSIISKLKTSSESSNSESHSNNDLLSTKSYQVHFNKILNSIIYSKIVNNKIEIHLLENISPKWKKGHLKNICLKGNIYADIKWTNQNINIAKLYLKDNKSYIENLVIFYNNKKYETKIEKDSLDLLNILPTTVAE